MIVALALPVFLVSGLSLRGWAIAAVLWFAVHVLELFVARAGAKPPLQVFAMFFKSIGVLVVLFVTVASDRDAAVAAAVTYALAYTFELGLSLVSYFGAER